MLADASGNAASGADLPLPSLLAAYGIVCAAVDTRTNQQVAIKKIGDIFSNPLDARRTLREIQVMCGSMACTATMQLCFL